MMLSFVDPFDQQLAEEGPAALFTFTHQGELQVDVMRTRELRRQNLGPFPLEQCHCIVIDSKTNWPQYALITSKRLCLNYDRGTIQVYATFQVAMESLALAKSQFYSTSSI